MSVINMMPREHHYTFSHRLLPREFFKDPPRLIAELASPTGGTFVFFLWEEIGKVVAQKLKAVDTGSLPGSTPRLQVLKLDVMGVATQADKTLVVVSLPPTEFPGEAMFVAAAVDGPRPRYFAFERTSGIAALGESPDSAYLGEYREDQSRVSHGAQPGTDAQSFVRAVCAVMGMNADHAWASISRGMPDPVAAGAFRPPAQPRPTGKRLAASGGVLSALVIALLAWPLVMRVIGSLLYSFIGYMPFHILHGLIGLLMGVVLLVWTYQLFDGLKGKVTWSPAMAVASWLIPVANLVLPPVILRAAWRAVSDNKGGLLPFLWWPLHLGVTFFTVFWQVLPALDSTIHGLGVDADVVATVFTALSWLTTLLELTSYGLMLYIVRTITRRA